MGRIINLEGKTINGIYVIEREGMKNGKATWLCKCHCGKNFSTRGVEDNHAFLNYNRFDDRYFTNNKKEHGQYITQFTQSEIDNLPECYKHPAVWEQIEVEIED